MLEHDLAGGSLPQTLLLYGPPSSGKFLTGLELARLVSCGEGGASSCICPSCWAMRRLQARNLFILSKTDLHPTFEVWNQIRVTKSNFHLFVRDVRRMLVNIGDETRYRGEADRLQELLQSLGADGAGENPERVDEIVDIALSVFPIPAGRNLGIDRMREVQRFVHVRSDDGRPKVVILDGAECMTEEAANSFLKVAEDPPPRAVILVIAADRKGLKDTIVSRCRAYRFKRLSEESREAALRDMGFDGTVPEFTGSRAQAMGELLHRLEQVGRDPHDAYTLVREMAERGQAPDFIGYLIEELSRAGRSARTPTLIGDLGALLKRLSALRSGIRYHHVHAETALTDYLLNFQEKYIHLKKQLTQ
jgi:DNA polymerase III delta prime subunit